MFSKIAFLIRASYIGGWDLNLVAQAAAIAMTVKATSAERELTAARRIFVMPATEKAPS
ncbi:MAG: hypothetical protein WA324_30450 [Bryobacteraceae bacterium]